MRLTQWTDYSLRVLMFCAQSESRQTAATIQEIAEQHDISKSHLTKIVMTLAADGYLITSRGRGGGLRLGRPASEIVIGEVVRKTESDFSIVECIQDGVSHCALMPSCRLKNVLADALKVFFENYNSQFFPPIYPRNIFKNLIPFGSAKIITFYSLATIFSNFFIRSFFVAISISKRITLL